MQASEVFAQRARFTILDVREPEEWEAGRIEGALHIPLGRLADSLAQLPLDRTIVAVCRSGHRSGEAAAFLQDRGYDAHNLEGGMIAWAAARLPFTTPGGEPGWVA